MEWLILLLLFLLAIHEQRKTRKSDTATEIVRRKVDWKPSMSPARSPVQAARVAAAIPNRPQSLQASDDRRENPRATPKDTASS